MSLHGFGVSQGLFVRTPGLIWGVQGGFGWSSEVQLSRGCWGVRGILGFQS